MNMIPRARHIGMSQGPSIHRCQFAEWVGDGGLTVDLINGTDIESDAYKKSMVGDLIRLAGVFGEPIAYMQINEKW